MPSTQPKSHSEAWKTVSLAGFCAFLAGKRAYDTAPRGFRGDCSIMSAGRAQPQARFPQENSRFRVCAALTARAATWRRRINCERCRFQGETIPADPLGCTDDATVSFREGVFCGLTAKNSPS